MRKELNSKIGDVFSIGKSMGYVILQCIAVDEPGIDVLRVLQLQIKDLSDFSPTLLELNERYFVKMTACAALKKNQIIFIGNYKVPSFVSVPKKYRMLDFVPHRNIKNWYTVDARTNSLKLISNLNEKFLKLSDHAIWNDTLLKERIEENWQLVNWK